jgi:hypothetical protein
MNSTQPKIFPLNDVSFAQATKNKAMMAISFAELLDLRYESMPRVRQRVAIIVDAMRLQTREGPAIIDTDAVLCQGVSGEYWQQAQATIDKNYIPTGRILERWTQYDPRPDRIVDVHQVTAQEASAYTHIQGRWGSVIDGIVNLQVIREGDWIGREPNDHANVWVIDNSTFDSTYGIL